MTDKKEQQTPSKIFDKVKKALQHIEEEVVVYPDEDGVQVEKEGGEKGDEPITNNQ